VSAPPLRLAAIVLAAGAGSRYSQEPGAKLLAPLEGRPLLAHVLETVRSVTPVVTIVVLGHGAATIERAIRWQGELRVVNRAPERGLSSSLHIGVQALRALPEPFDGAFIVLGDQPRLRPDVLRLLAGMAEKARAADRPLIVPRYEDDPGPRNPVLLLPSAWAWAEGLKGDRGLAPLIDVRPESVLEVQVPGEMPDVDEPADLERVRGTSASGTCASRHGTDAPATDARGSGA
jgi:molybdenum cofactor cytidylyltransferase